jgi:hypothetical protein
MARPAEFWERVRTEYTCGIKQQDGETYWPSFKEMAKTYGISDVAIAKKARIDKWERVSEKVRAIKVRRQEKFANKFAERKEKEIESKMDDLAGAYIDFDLECIRQARRAIGLIKTALDEIENKIRLEGKGAVPPQMIDRYMSALEKAQRIGKNAAGEQMPNSPVLQIEYVDGSEILPDDMPGTVISAD